MAESLALGDRLLLVHSHVRAGRLAEAESICRQILSNQPDRVETLVNYSIVLLRLDRPDEALTTAARAISLKPSTAEAHNTLGNIYAALGRFDEALQSYEQAIALRPDRASFHNNRGSALQLVSRLDEAIESFDKAIALQPGLETAEANRLFAMHFHPAYGPQQILRELRKWAGPIEAGLAGSPSSHRNDRSPERRLRIGYVSPHFRDHCLARLMLPIVREHDSGQVEIYFYSDAVDPDFMTGKFRGLADSWRDTASFTHEALAEQIRADQIDILVDLTLHMSGSRLLSFARKPARVQLTYGGYPSSTGLQAMDYRLTDPYLDPPGVGDELYAEQSVRLPDCFWCYVPDGPQPDVSALPSDHVGVITFGCLNNFSKVNDDVLRTWAQVMRHVERSRLLLLAPAGSARQRTLHVLAAQGISPDRVEFTPHQPLASYLKTYDRIDIGLDTFPYNGHTTSLDSFWMGVPVVTLVGRAAVGRAGWSLLSNLGLTELAATHEAQFISTAVELAQDRPRLHRLRHELRSRMLQSPLTDSRRFAGNLESVYRSIWRRWCEKVES